MLAALATAPLALAGQDAREAAEARILAVFRADAAEWGEGFVLGPLPAGSARLASVEAELARMEPGAAGERGPDLARRHLAGAAEAPLAWRSLGELEGRALGPADVGGGTGGGACYVYAAVRSPLRAPVELACATPGGVRIWWNGQEVAAREAGDPGDPGELVTPVLLRPGKNHLLVLAAGIDEGWSLSLESRRRLSPRLLGVIRHRLDRDFPAASAPGAYRVIPLPVPREVVLEVGGIDFLPDGTPLVATRRGEVLRVEGAYADPPTDVRFEPFAAGLHEPLGLAVRDDGVWVVQRPELTRLVDEDGDGRADLYACMSAAWGLSGNYHEFAFGPAFDAAGDAWVALGVAFSGGLGVSGVPYRGWALRVTPDGRTIPVCDGLRSPNGIARFTDGTMLVLDNQGDHVETNRLSRLAPGLWHGHPASLRWRTDLAGPDERPPREPACVWFPYRRMGQSAADLALDDTGGAFGPFEGQLFVGDQTLALVMRVDLERVLGTWQGACFPFLSGLACGVNRVAFAPDGSLFVGETSRGWASAGRRPYGLERVVFDGATPFEMRSIRVHERGFRVELTLPVDRASAADPASWSVSSFTYPYQSGYYAPEVDARAHEVLAARVLDERTVELELAGLDTGRVVELAAPGVRSAAGAPLAHDEAYYTLQRLPGRPEEPRPELPRALVLTGDPAGHAALARPDPFVLSVAELSLREAARGSFDVVASADLGWLEPSRLATLDAVVLVGAPPAEADPAAWEALAGWLERGGALVGVHGAADVRPGAERLGALFGGSRREGPSEAEDLAAATLARTAYRTLAPAAPALRSLPAEWQMAERPGELAIDGRAPLAGLLALADEPASWVAWCRAWGRGRVAYVALGHRDEAWKDARFLRLVLGALAWALGEGEVLPAPQGARVLLAADPAGADPRALGAAWRSPTGDEVRWSVEDGGAFPAPGAGALATSEPFDPRRLHVEFRSAGAGGARLVLPGGRELRLGGSAPADDAWHSLDVRLAGPEEDPASPGAAAWLDGQPLHALVSNALPGAGRARPAPLGLRDADRGIRLRNLWVVPR